MRRTEGWVIKLNRRFYVMILTKSCHHDANFAFIGGTGNFTTTACAVSEDNAGIIVCSTSLMASLITM